MTESRRIQCDIPGCENWTNPAIRDYRWKYIERKSIDRSRTLNMFDICPDHAKILAQFLEGKLPLSESDSSLAEAITDPRDSTAIDTLNEEARRRDLPGLQMNPSNIYLDSRPPAIEIDSDTRDDIPF